MVLPVRFLLLSIQPNDLLCQPPNMFVQPVPNFSNSPEEEGGGMMESLCLKNVFLQSQCVVTICQYGICVDLRGLMNLL